MACSGRLAIEALAEAVSHTVLAGRIVRAGNGDAGKSRSRAAASLFSATATALEVEPVIAMILFSVMKRCCSCTALFGLAPLSATTNFTSLPSTPLVVLGEIFLISSWPH